MFKQHLTGQTLLNQIKFYTFVLGYRGRLMPIWIIEMAREDLFEVNWTTLIITVKRNDELIVL